LGLRLIENKHLLLCEGAHDAEFFRGLIKEHNLPPFTVASFGVGGSDDDGGRDRLTLALDGLPSIPGFHQVETILIVADNDSDPKASFNTVVEFINRTRDIGPGRRYIAPAAPQTRAGLNPAIVVLMIPWTNVPGALDTLCFSAAFNKRPTIGTSVIRFSIEVQSMAWPVTKVSKMKLRSLISAANAKNPYLSPAWVWSEKTDLVPLSDPSFNNIKTFLQSFA
jgi:hypothetical protein